MKLSIITCLSALFLLQSLDASGFRSVGFTRGPELFREGDSIEIKEVEAKNGSFEVGDEVIFSGIYTLESRSNAKLGLFVTQTKGDGKSEVFPGQELVISEETGAFELSIKVRHEGYLHVSFYPVNGGNGFGGVYFGKKKQMKEIEHWDLTDYLTSSLL